MVQVVTGIFPGTLGSSARLWRYEICHRLRAFWPSSAGATACMVSVDSQALIVREEKRFTVAGHAGARRHDLRRRDRDPVVGRADVLVEIEKRGADAGSRR